MKNVRGIKFNIMDEEAATNFLKYNNYYFKMKSYAKNYDKYLKGENTGKYINLEFAYLVEISKMDMYFRRIILKLTLDMEHFLKTQLLRDCQENEKENGYDIIDDFFLRNPDIKQSIDKQGENSNSASSDLILKYKENFAIWNIVEILTFYNFTKLYELYYRKYKTSSSMEQYLWSLRFLRNAAAHNSCLLNSLRTPYNKKVTPSYKVMNFLSQIDGISRIARQNRMKNPVVHDFVVTLYMFKEMPISQATKEATIGELKYFMNNQVTRNKEYFQKNEILISHYEFVKKVVDFLSEVR